MIRYLAICHPLYSYTMSGLRRASKIIATLWLFALAAAIPYAVFTEVHYIDHPFTNQVIPCLRRLLKTLFALMQNYHFTLDSATVI